MCNINGLGMEFLKTLREERKWSKYRMAKELEMLPQTYHHYEASAKSIKLTELSKIRDRLKLSWSKLGKMIDEEFGE